jgi:hypothetical protein
MGGQTMGGGGGQAPAGNGCIVPLYSYPDASAWTAIVQAKQAHAAVNVVAIVNPDSGPGTSVDGTFTSGIAKLVAAGIVPIGYVSTSYTKRGQAAVEADIDTWRASYATVTGIFFDAKLKCYLVVVEDRNEASLKQFKEPKFLKTGDEVNGLRIGTVTAEKAAFLRGEIAKELLVGESLPGSDGKTAAPATSEDPEASPSSSDGEEKVDIKPLDHEEKTKVLEQMRKQRGKKNRPNNEEQ